jgi:hypothetical protein
MKFNRSLIPSTLIGLVITLSVSFTDTACADPGEKHVIGWVEKIQVLPENLQFMAKIDTGADNSSLSVIDPTEFTKGEEDWIRFSVPLGEDKTVTIERPIERFTRIKNKGGPSQRRAVVLFDLCLGTIFKKNIQVNLAKRKGFKYPMLIGRSFLKGSAIVDSALTHTLEPSCATPASQ